MKRVAAVAAVALLAGCGGGSKVHTLYRGPEWGVQLDGGKAQVIHLVGGKWDVEGASGVKLSILGPQPGARAPNPPQVAVEIHSKSPIVELFLWIDGDRLIEKGGGSPTDFTMYGSPYALEAGTHTAVGYARSDFGGAAVAWTFTTGKPARSG